MMIKKILVAISFIVACSSPLSALCIKGIGNTCPEKQSKQENKGNGIQLNFNPFGVSADGGDRRRDADGDKSKNQGYSAYKRWAFGLMVSVYAVPYQDGNQYTGADGLSAFVEHNISEYFTIGITHLQQKFNYLNSEFDDQNIEHKHTAAYAGVRIWISKKSVIRANLGVANSEVVYLGKNLSGTTEYISAGYEYALDESDSSRIGYRYISIAGKDEAEDKNIGMSAHGITFQVLF